MGRVQCSDEFSIKRLISKKKQKKKRKEERSYALYKLDLRFNEFFYFLFMIHEATRYARC